MCIQMYVSCVVQLHLHRCVPAWLPDPLGVRNNMQMTASETNALMKS